jgi:hypothetical protein
MHTNKWSKFGFMKIELDISKAYDRVKWCFLEAVIRKLGFAERLITLIMSCVQSVSYAILINRQAVGNIQPTRGLRRGDPLSPYRFLFCAKALSSLLQQVETKESITGVPTSKQGPRLSHLFFEDDNLLFCKANSVE